MKNRSKQFFESDEAVSASHRARVLARVAPVLEENRRRSERAGLWVWLQPSRLFPLSAAAALGLGALFFYSPKPRQESPVAVTPVATPAATSVAVAPPVVESPFVEVPHKSTGPRVTKRPPKVSTQVALEFVKELDLLFVLHVLPDLDVLLKWSGKSETAFLQFLDSLPWLTSAQAAELRLNERFLDQMLEVFPQIPVAEQEKFLGSLDRVRRLRQEQKELLVTNYQAWQATSKEQREKLHEEFRSWRELTPAKRTEVLGKYEKWKKLPASEQDQIRRHWRSG